MTRMLKGASALALLAIVPLAAACSKTGESAPVSDGAASVATTAAAATGPAITVYKSPTCGCCTKWEDHLRENGFRVESVTSDDVAAIKRARGVPLAMQSCHTGVVDGYAIEGHVPADVIRKLLAERPAVKGIAVPGMPMGSPGMEGPYKDDYEVFTFDETGPKDVYAVR
ncbi:MAG TPA: DUF411 domain-containing protein [Longimicrobiaceae bacterium]|nr:DUF411 domain-containing protein [Longimicrobiaceae bacterium]